MRSRCLQAQEDHDSGQRPESHRPRNRVRLLLLPCVVRAAGIRRSNRSWSIAIRKPCRPTTTPATGLYFEPLTLEEVLNICDTEKPDGVIVQFGGQTPLTLAIPLKNAGVPIIGTDPENIDLAEDRKLLRQAAGRSEDSFAGERLGDECGRGVHDRAFHRLSGAGAAQLRAGRPRHGDRLRRRHGAALYAGSRVVLAKPSRADRPVPGRRYRSRRRRACRYDRRGADRRHHGAYRGSGRAFRRFELRAAAPLRWPPTSSRPFEPTPRNWRGR